MFEIDLKKLILQLLPTFYRQQLILAITEAGSRIAIATTEDSFNEKGEYQDDNLAVPVLSNEAMLTAQQNSFLVAVPADLYQTNLADIKALVDSYKLISKQAIYTPIS